jgi:hypothetical protein
MIVVMIMGGLFMVVKSEICFMYESSRNFNFVIICIRYAFCYLTFNQIELNQCHDNQG